MRFWRPLLVKPADFGHTLCEFCTMSVSERENGTLTEAFAGAAPRFGTVLQGFAWPIF